MSQALPPIGTKLTLTYLGTTSNTMKVQAGTNKVDLSGKTDILAKCQSVGTIYPGKGI